MLYFEFETTNTFTKHILEQIYTNRDQPNEMKKLHNQWEDICL